MPRGVRGRLRGRIPNRQVRAHPQPANNRGNRARSPDRAPVQAPARADDRQEPDRVLRGNRARLHVPPPVQPQANVAQGFEPENPRADGADEQGDYPRRNEADEQRGNRRGTPPAANAERPRHSRKRGRDELELDEVTEHPLLQNDADVWVLGDSIPYWAGVRAEKTGKPNLRLQDIQIGWWGVRGLGWQGFRHQVEAQVLLCLPPKMIIVSLGGNDLTNIKTPGIREIIQREVSYLRDALPNTVIVWMDILQRRVWKGARDGHKTLEQKRKRLNRLGRRIVLESGNGDVIMPDIDSSTNFYRSDGVHLNDVGLEFYLDYIKDVISKHCST
ncbi:uncharacterized protein LOC123525283 [Mercenaria mercenaria]|uniref:uncharacterized protein LOC123525283 n=1 Tax=Mercenaria mercenaria TaxID=6596 RepID=UPI001E1DFF99|nr:uncharacterized protein LOC123525283 [Mercenaria mercenaria]